MLSKLLSHARGNVVAYLALFVALGGTAVAARPLITGADIVDGSLTGADVQNDSLTGSDVLESSLSGGAPNLGIAASNITGTISDAQVSDTLTASSAANADTLDGKDSTDFLTTSNSVGGFLSGRIKNLGPDSAVGAVSGITDWALAAGDRAAYTTLSPPVDLVAKDFSFRLTRPPGLGTSRFFWMQVGSSQQLLCSVADDDSACQNGSTTVAIPANSEIGILVGGQPLTKSDVLFGWRAVLSP